MFHVITLSAHCFRISHETSSFGFGFTLHFDPFSPSIFYNNFSTYVHPTTSMYFMEKMPIKSTSYEDRENINSNLDCCNKRASTLKRKKGLYCRN